MQEDRAIAMQLNAEAEDYETWNLWEASDNEDDQNSRPDVDAWNSLYNIGLFDEDDSPVAGPSQTHAEKQASVMEHLPGEYQCYVCFISYVNS